MENPKEKAKELVDKFMQYSMAEIKEPWGRVQERKENAKQCTLIAVEEIINELLGIINDRASVRVTDAIKPTVKFWQQVKSEIENL